MPVYHDMAAPPCPIFLKRFKGIESPRVHILDAVLLLEVPEVFLEPFPGISQPRRGRQSRPRSDYYGIAFLNRQLQPLDLVRADGGRFPRQYP